MIQRTAPETVPPLAAFVRALFDEEIAVVSSSAAIPSVDAEAERLLRTAHGALSRTLAGHAPEFSLAGLLPEIHRTARRSPVCGRTTSEGPSVKTLSPRRTSRK